MAFFVCVLGKKEKEEKKKKRSAASSQKSVMAFEQQRDIVEEKNEETIPFRGPVAPIPIAETVILLLVDHDHTLSQATAAKYGFASFQSERNKGVGVRKTKERVEKKRTFFLRCSRQWSFFLEVSFLKNSTLGSPFPHRGAERRHEGCAGEPHVLPDGKKEKS